MKLTLSIAIIQPNSLANFALPAGKFLLNEMIGLFCQMCGVKILLIDYINYTVRF